MNKLDTKRYYEKKRVEALVRDTLTLTNLYPVDQKQDSEIKLEIFHCLNEISYLLDFELEEEY